MMGVAANREATESRVPMVKLKSSLRGFTVATMTGLTVTEYLCHK